MNSLLRISWAAALLMSVVTTARADPSTECSIDNSSQVETRRCLDQALINADAAMKISFDFAMKSATELDQMTGRKVAVSALKTGQSTWSQYRDKHCDYVGTTFGGGSGTGIAILSCRIEFARLRADQLMKFAR